LIFESGSKLTRIDANALCGCSSLKSIHFPASLQTIDGSALSETRICKITIEEGCCQFSFSDHCLIGGEVRSVVRYFGSDSDVTLNREIEILSPNSFSRCNSISSLSFESGSKLTRIEARALSCCSSLKSICIPA
jgi:hypothetical protein